MLKWFLNILSDMVVDTGPDMVIVSDVVVSDVIIPDIVISYVLIPNVSPQSISSNNWL